MKHIFKVMFGKSPISPVTAQTLYDQEKNGYLTTGCLSIDNCLKGGILKRSISEVDLLKYNDRCRLREKHQQENHSWLYKLRSM